MSTTKVNFNPKQSQNFANGNDNIGSDIASSTKDVFEGQVLIDRLLLYYNKFEGSRERAARYAQKLLELGHIECMTNGRKFEDSAHLYMWTDANKVVNEAKAKAVEQQRNIPIRTVVKNENVGKSVLKISIETDNCQAAEIQANIKASPRANGESHSKKIYVDPKSVTTVEEDSFFGRRITKTLSYLSDGKTEQENHRLTTPYITDVSTLCQDSRMTNSCVKTDKKFTTKDSSSQQNMKECNSIDHNNTHNNNEATKKASLISEKNEESHNRALSPRKKLFNPNSSPLETKQQLKNVAQGHKTSLLSRKSATEPVIAKEFSPGSNGILETRCNALEVNHVNGQTHLERGQLNLMHTNRESQKNVPERNENSVKPLMLIASTQTSEKSILEASRIYNGSESKKSGKRSPSPAPRRRTLSLTDKKEDKSSGEEVSMEEKDNDSKENELHRTDQTKQQKKTQFGDEVSKTASSSEKQLSNSDFREQFDMMNVHQMPLHSTGIVEDTNAPESMLNCYDSTPPVSPPPPSPTVRHASSKPPPVSPMKSLFWTKISKRELKKKNRKIFWEEAVDEILIDEDEFKKLFSKQDQHPLIPRIKIGELSENGKVLKVLGMERSRQVGIRASSVRLPIEDIHDAIINMDDEKLDADALQALCDVRPTPDELDKIADALKARPNAILDKPEQFILMLAMIPSLDDRLRCWIFVKKFPDKIVEIQEQLLSLNDVCVQTMQSITFKKILEIVLLLGNRMNRGSQRGGAYGFYLDILPKLKDVKSKNGDTNLLEYVVKALREQMKLDGTLDEQLLTPRGSKNCGLPNQELLCRAISVSLADLGEELEKQAMELNNCKENLLPAVVKESTVPAEAETFQVKFEEFLKTATEKLLVQAQLYRDVLLTAEDFQHYYMPNTETFSKENLFTILRSIADFSTDFRQQWIDAQKEEIKEEFYKIRKYKKERQAEIHVRNTPSALKERFLSRRRPNSSESNGFGGKMKPQRSESNRRYHTHPLSPDGTPIPRRSYKFEEPSSRNASATHNGRSEMQDFDTLQQERASISERAVENSMRIEKRMQALKRQSSKI